MKKLISLFAGLLLLANVTQAADSGAITVTFSPPNVQLLSGPAVIHRVQFLAGNAASTLRLYDSSNIAITNASGIPVIVTPATTNFVSYATNYTFVTTSAYNASVTYTNTVSGIFSGPVVAAQATNALPVLTTLLSAANGLNDIDDLNISVTRGVVANLGSTENGTVAITYTPQQ